MSSLKNGDISKTRGIEGLLHLPSDESAALALFPRTVDAIIGWCLLLCKIELPGSCCFTTERRRDASRKHATSQASS